MAIDKKRVGRPAKSPTPGSRVSLGLKVTAEIKEKLDGLAKASGRTQSQEAEIRLERSFWQESLIGDSLALAYGNSIAGVVRVVAETIHLAEKLARLSAEVHGDDLLRSRILQWETDPILRSSVLTAGQKMIEILKAPSLAHEFGIPSGPYDQASLKHAAEMGKVSFSAVVMVLRELRIAEVNNTHSKWSEILDMLGPLGEALPKDKGR